MRARLGFALRYYIFWLFYFLFSRGLFLIYQREQASELRLADIAGSFLYGLKLDASFAGYVSMIPFLLLAISGFFHRLGWLRQTLRYYTGILIFLFTILITADLELFRIWGFRLDSTPLNYLNTPGEMLASVGSSPILLITALNVLFNVGFGYFYKHWSEKNLKNFSERSYASAPALIFAAALLIIPMRGGFQQIPINQSSVFFSKSLFANQTALNVPWNFFHSLKKGRHNKDNPYRYFAPEQADSLASRLLPVTKARTKIDSGLLKAENPNVVLIIWESFTAKVVESLGGLPGVTPGFDSLSREGLLFSQAYASGDRSDKGLVAILSGYPAQPSTTIIKTPAKAAKLPQLSHAFKEAGYKTGFYYGGELEFANLRSYLRFGGYDTLVSKDAFEEKDMNSKWGAHDHVVFERMLKDLNQMPQPFFSTLFTLSSHEPFEVPMKERFTGKGEETKFLNSMAYTDSALVAFLHEASRQPWFENTLFVIIADHGHPYPGMSPVYAAEKFHIPMLWWGPALAKNAEGIHTAVLSQTDLAATLLNQLNISSEPFPWSRNVLAPDYRPAASYYFQDGVAIVTDSSRLSWDNIGRQPIKLEGDTAALPYARAYLQKTFGDYLEK